MTERVKKSSEQACSKSQKLATLANAMSKNLDDLASNGVPVRPLSEDDSMVTMIEVAVEAQKRAKTASKPPL